MKILQIIHDFLPRHQAGSELYCYHLSKSLQRLGHEVRLCFAEIDHGREAFAVRGGEYDGLPFYEIVNNHAYANFRETYANPGIERRFKAILEEYKPDIAHFHHLLGLSFGCVRLCRERNIPVVFTLHDYWLTCPRGGGQRFRGEGKVCHEVDTSLCAECISRFTVPNRFAQRLAKGLANRLGRGGGSLAGALARGRIRTPNRAFVHTGVCAIGGDERESLFMHPPSSAGVRVAIPENASLSFAYAMAPSTYEQPGEGVRFAVKCGGETVFEHALNAKGNPADRGWKRAEVDLSRHAGRRRELVFETSAHPGDGIDHCSACWAEPRILAPHGAAPPPAGGARLAALAEKWLAFPQKASLRNQAERRRREALELFNAADLFVAPSRFLRDKFIEYGMPPEKIVFSDYGIAPVRAQPAPREGGPVRFAYVGTVAEHKGLHVLIEAFNGLPRESAELNVHGALDEFEGYAGRVRSMIAHPGIHLRGRFENHRAAEILANADALIVPSIWFENSPITIHEAFLARVPVIASNFGGMAGLVRDGVNGLLFEMGDPAGLRRVLLRVLNEPGLLDRLRPDPAEVKSLEDDAAWTEQRYRGLLRARGG